VGQILGVQYIDSVFLAVLALRVCSLDESLRPREPAQRAGPASIEKVELMKIAVVGTGYVGLVAGACLAENGNDVVCVDKDARKVKLLQKGTIPIYEPGLEHLLARNIKEERLTFTTDIEEAVINCNVLFLCLPTPPGGDGAADLGYVLKAAAEIGRLIVKNDISEPRIIVNKSTVPVGTVEKVRRVFKEAAPDADITVVSRTSR